MKSESTPKQMRSRKAPSSAWKRGQSGNPGGRPKVVAEIRELARQHGHEAIQRLVALMHSSNEGVAVRAAEALLDRGYGRPLQGLELNSVDATSQRWHVELVPTPTRESLPANGVAQLTQGPCHPSAGTIISCEMNGVGVPTNRRWLG
jgi:Family of unknown function (DUF5681)